MQLYEGLPIITNKITSEEQQGVPHHLLGCIGLDEQTWVVGTFVRKALAVIDEIRGRGKVPILVGGTHYYTQSLLFHERFSTLDGEHEYVEHTAEKWPILGEPTEVVLKELQRVDPIMAGRWHPNDRRKIQRSLEIFLQTGKPASELYAEQRQKENRTNDIAGSDLDKVEEEQGGLRMPTLLFWVHAQQDVLRARLDKRVNSMLDIGLLDEVMALRAFANRIEADGSLLDESKGIYVSIGFKEFHNYVEALQNGESSDAELRLLQAEAVERTQIATRQYAKRQLRWIRIKLINALANAQSSQSLYLLDGTDVSRFEKSVVIPASELLENFLTASRPMPDPKALSDTAAEFLSPRRDYDLAATPNKWFRQECEVCGVTCVTEQSWETHVKSKTHRKLMSKAKKAVTSLTDGNAQDKPS